MTTQIQSKSASCLGFVCSCIQSIIFWICSVICCIAVAIVLYALLAGIFYSDPENEMVPTDPSGWNETLLWREATGQGGLEVEVLNALDDTWISTFDEYIQRWDSGYQKNDSTTIDPLSLSVQRVALDPECQPVAGKLKNCNADYGRTDWRGLNIALTDQTNYIQSSISKYNDYWITSGDSQNVESQMKYTMCHELGHGWGLPHTDENYFNTPTGECMDYTEFPEDNLDCGEYNFNLLHDLYGNGERRMLRTPMSETRTLSEELLEEYRVAVQEISQDSSCSYCILDLSNGYRVFVHKLLV